MGRRGRPPYPDILTPREWEVLGLLRHGLSNPEIAERLGISRDGAKFHVSEILGKLGLSSREEAAAWQPEEHRPWWAAAGAPIAFISRRVTAMPVGLSSVAMAVSGGLLLAAVGVLGLIAFLLLRGGEVDEPTAVATETAVVVPVTDLFTDPRPRAPDEVRELGPPPPSSFEPWDVVSTVLYDTLTGEELNLGQGHFGRFSPNGARMAWTAGPPYEPDEQKVWVIDLSTLERRPLGPGRIIRFVDDDHAVVQLGSEGKALVDLRNGERTPADDVPPRQSGWTLMPGTLRLQQTQNAPDGIHNTYAVTDIVTGRTVLELEVEQARPAGPGELVVATLPENGMANIFIVEIASGQATFIATSRWMAWNDPLAANEDYVLWTEDYCRPLDAGKTRLFDRRTDSLIELDATLWATFTPGGLIASGTFGARALIDPETLEYVVVVPGRAPGAETGSASDLSWSPDYRYFSQGFAGGHGGLCP